MAEISLRLSAPLPCFACSRLWLDKSVLLLLLNTPHVQELIKKGDVVIGLRSGRGHWREGVSASVRDNVNGIARR